MYGWMGKILYVNLTDSLIKVINSKPYVEKYQRGRGRFFRLRGAGNGCKDHPEPHLHQGESRPVRLGIPDFIFIRHS